MSIEDDIAAVRKIAAIYEAGGVWHNLTMTEDTAVKVRLADEVERLRKDNASLRDDLKVTVQGYEKYEQQLEKAVEALRNFAQWDGDEDDTPMGVELARAVLKELEK